MQALIRNSLRTPDGTILESYDRYDYKIHKDTNGKIYMVDGGLSYSRCSANGDEINLCLYDDEPHEIQRDIILWGTYGKGGKEPLHYLKVGEMETAHIKAVLKECNPSLIIKKCMKQELSARKEK